MLRSPFSIRGERQRTEERWAEPGQIFPGNVPSAMRSSQAETQVVLPTVLSLVLVGEAAVKGGSFVVLDFSLDVFSHPDS